MNDRTLFPLPEPDELALPPAARPDEVRLARPVREQVQLIPHTLDELLPADHKARAIWRVLEQLDLAAFYRSIKTFLDRPGRAAIDPRMLLALWLMATVEGIGSARRLARLCEEHDAYRWICGGVSVNYHTLSDFRVGHKEALDDLLTQIIASLLASKTVKLERVAQDGMRVRASAGAGSFRKRSTLKSCLREARAQVKRLAEEHDQPDSAMTKREQAARERAAQEREKRVRRALDLLPQLQVAKERQAANYDKKRREKVTEPRASTTDPEARVMKMPDGGFRPAYNVEFATDVDSGIIVGASVTAEGTDARQAVPMEEQIERRTGQRPDAYLMDGGFASNEAVITLEQRGVTVFAPVRSSRNRPPHTRFLPRKGEPSEVTSWRRRMGTPEAQQVYRLRASTAEWTNAQVRQHGINAFLVRGLLKVTAVTLLAAIAHNLLQASF